MGNGTITNRINPQPISTDNSRDCSKNTDDARGSWLGRMVSKVGRAIKKLSKTVIPDLTYIAVATIFLCTGSAVSAGILFPVSVFYLGISIIRLVDIIRETRHLHSVRTAK